MMSQIELKLAEKLLDAGVDLWCSVFTITPADLLECLVKVYGEQILQCEPNEILSLLRTAADSLSFVDWHTGICEALKDRKLV